MPLPSIRFRFSNEIRQAGAFHVCTALTRYRRGNNTMNIQCTSDYDKFQHLTGNRPVNTDQVSRIAKLMEAVGFIASYHIVVNKKMQILDGQHRVEAAKIAKVPVYYTVDDKMEISTVQKAGTLSRAWTAMDHIKARAEAGNAHFQALILIYESSKFLPAMTTEIIIRTHSSRMRFLSEVKSGTFETNEFFQLLFADTYSRLMDLDEINAKFLDSRYALRGVLSLLTHPNYDHEQLKRKLEFQSTRLVKCISPTEYMNLMFDIYNFKEKGKSRIEPLRKSKS